MMDVLRGTPGQVCIYVETTNKHVSIRYKLFIIKFSFMIFAPIQCGFLCSSSSVFSAVPQSYFCCRRCCCVVRMFAFVVLFLIFVLLMVMMLMCDDDKKEVKIIIIIHSSSQPASKQSTINHLSIHLPKAVIQSASQAAIQSIFVWREWIFCFNYFHQCEFYRFLLSM